MKNMKKLSLVIVVVLTISLLFPSISYAGTWKSLSVSKSGTSSYTTSTFKSDGDILIDLSVVQTYIGNSGTLQLQRLTSGSWNTVKTITKSLNVATTVSPWVSTLFGSQIKGSNGYYRLVFTSNQNVNISGSIQYFVE